MAQYTITWVESRTVTGTFSAIDDGDALRIGSALALQNNSNRIAADAGTRPTVTAVTALGEQYADGTVRAL